LSLTSRTVPILIIRQIKLIKVDVYKVEKSSFVYHVHTFVHISLSFLYLLRSLLFTACPQRSLSSSTHWPHSCCS
jgi:hypothetical protein